MSAASCFSQDPCSAKRPQLKESERLRSAYARVLDSVRLVCWLFGLRTLPSLARSCLLESSGRFGVNTAQGSETVCMDVTTHPRPPSRHVPPCKTWLTKPVRFAPASNSFMRISLGRRLTRNHDGKSSRRSGAVRLTLSLLEHLRGLHCLAAVQTESAPKQPSRRSNGSAFALCSVCLVLKALQLCLPKTVFTSMTTKEIPNPCRAGLACLLANSRRAASASDSVWPARSRKPAVER